MVDVIRSRKGPRDERRLNANLDSKWKVNHQTQLSRTIFENIKVWTLWSWLYFSLANNGDPHTCVVSQLCMVLFVLLALAFCLSMFFVRLAGWQTHSGNSRTLHACTRSHTQSLNRFTTHLQTDLDANQFINRLVRTQINAHTHKHSHTTTHKRQH